MAAPSVQTPSVRKMAIARVEPLTTARALRGPFDYRLPEEMSDVCVGSVLRVPFGRRRLLGVVVELAESSELPAERVAEPIEALEAGATPELVRLGLWVAREYCSTPSRGLALVLPPGTGAAGQRVRARHELHVEATADGIAALAGSERLGPRQRAALDLLRTGELPASELALGAADRAAIRRLEHRGLVRSRKLEARRSPRHVRLGAPPRSVRLLPEQRAAAVAVRAALDREPGASRELLLYGVTGSGKTEVYLAAAEAALARGRGAIVLVPEIGLTPQAVARFRTRLGDRIAVLHSALTAGERYDEWRRMRAGEAEVCVGPRSAVFAPVEDLGLIVIDEEHEPSYKQGGDPRYDARTVARRRAGQRGAVLIAGSATPRPESWFELSRVELPRRVDDRELPAVEVLDMRGTDPRAGPLHGRAAEALQVVRDARSKAIVLINRRGFAPHLCCRSCGRHWGCPSCDVSLVLHRGQERLRCHHCGYWESVPRECAACGSVTLARVGTGTERIEDLLAQSLAPLPIFRLDSDTAARGSHAEILARFEAADGGVLVGTQMVGKGHDFPDVTLSLILDADATLRFPDFRSEERTFAMVAQLAGRSGRGEAGGRVIVQTLAPSAPSIAHAARHDAPGFLAEELERRSALRYPPFGHLLKIGLAGVDEGRLDRAAIELRGGLGGAVPTGTEVLGPAPLFRIRGKHRRRFLLKAADRAGTVAAVRAEVDGMASSRALRGVSIGVDVDPQ
jgi:primosomal protein N' (replication factor Y) (superfamily II helicase)